MKAYFDMAHIGDLHSDTKNPRKHSERNIRAIVKSLEECGAARSIVIDEHGNILAGNGLIEAASIAGIENVQIVEADGNTIVAVRRSNLTEKQKKRLAVLDNRAGELAEWNPDVLQDLIAEGVDLSDLWFEDELAALLASVSEQEPEGLLPGVDPDAIPENVETRCKPGDLWQLGRHRILCGDATSATDYETLIGDESPAMVWADPPYGIEAVSKDGFTGIGAKGTPFGGVKNNGKSNPVSGVKYAAIIGDDTTGTAVDSYNFAASVCPDAVHIWWGGNYYADKLPASRCWIVWDKETGGNNFADAELAYTNMESSVRVFRHMWNGMVKASEHGQKRVHPTQKPVALAEWAFEKYGQDGDIIFDPFLGSGMSIIAAEKTSRKVYGMELSPEYCDVIIKRWEQATGKTAELINGETK